MLKCLFQRLGNEHTKREVEEELGFHLDLLTEEYSGQSATLEDPKAGELKQFGNSEQVRDECVAISRRNRPYLWLLKLFFTLIFVGGVMVRVFSTEYHVTRVGDILMAVGILSRLLLYLRLLPPGSIAKPEASPGLMLSEPGEKSINFYDQRRRTPVERVIFKE